MFDLLQGLKIIDLTTVVLGPYTTQILGDLGADIVKVESPEGDVFRAVRPGRKPDLGVQFQNFNRNKRSIVIDLKQDRGRGVLHALVKNADVVVHNMRSRSAASLGASYEALKAIKPDLVYCYSAGYGDDGPDRDAPAYDDVIQARSGLAQLNADESGAPQFVRTIAGDKTVGLHLAIAVLAGVVKRERSGQGCCIAAPMLESMTSFLLAEHLAGHSLIPAEGSLGYARVISEHRRPYRTKDGYVAILPYSTKHWTRFFNMSSRPELASDPRVTDPALRSEHIDTLYETIAAEALHRSTAEWLQLLQVEDIPCARVNALADLYDDVQLRAVGMFEDVSDPELGDIRQLRSPFQVNGERYNAASDNRRAPRLGEHSDAILKDAGIPDAEIESLLSDGIILGRPTDG